MSAQLMRWFGDLASDAEASRITATSSIITFLSAGQAKHKGMIQRICLLCAVLTRLVSFQAKDARLT